MPQKTKKSVSPQRSTKESSLATDSYMPVSQPTKPSFFSLKNNRFVKVVIGVVLLAIILGFLARRYKSALIVASVNGTPVLRAELNERLINRFGSQMLEALIGERLITQEAAKQNIQISNEEVTAKIAEIEKSVSGSMSLDDSLKLQGITKDEFKNQVRIQLAIDKMFTQNATTSTAEVDDFMKKNATSLTASTEAEKRAQAEKELKNQKVSQAFIEWFNKVKEAAKVQRYL